MLYSNISANSSTDFKRGDGFHEDFDIGFFRDGEHIENGKGD
jgi:hypothetical protein